MTGWRQRYSVKESLNRISRAFQSGNVVTDDTQGAVPGELLSENQAFSDLAEILNNSLPTETPTVPNAIRASVAEAEAGTNNTKAVTPLGLAGGMGAIVSTLVEHGNIYAVAGTAAQDLVSATWYKPTGVFTADGLSSSNVTPDYSTDQIDVDLPGTYLVGMQVSVEGELGYVLQGAVYLDGTIQPQLQFETDIEVTGSVSCSVIGTVSVTGSNSELEMYLRADAGTPEIVINTASLQVIGIPVI